MKVFCCLLTSQRCKVFPSFMHFSAFKFSLQKWNNIRVCCQKRIEQCQLFCCFCKQASFFLELSHFVLILKQKATKNEISFFSWQLRNQQFFSLPNVSFFKQAKCCCNRFILLPLTRKKQRKPLFSNFSSKTTSFVSNLDKARLTHKCNADF